MELDGPVRLLGETDRISSGSAREGGKIATGLEFNKAAHLLTTFMNEIIVRGEVPGIWQALKQTLKDLIIDSTLAWLWLRFVNGFFILNPSLFSPLIRSWFCLAVTVGS